MHNTSPTCPRILLTPGEPAGIGPDLAVTIAQQRQDYELVAVANPSLLLERADALGLKLCIRLIKPEQAPRPTAAGEIAVYPVELGAKVNAGELNAANAAYVLKTLDAAIDLCQRDLASAIVTGPVHKGIINDAGVTFSGHTEYLADKTNTEQVVMMLTTEGLRVALATTHIPLAAVPNAITSDLLTRVISILHTDLQHKFGILHPNILVCGLNPHAGEGGHMGREEIDTITPTLERLRALGMQLQGPLPADTLFTPKVLDGADAVLAMYHDQGLPVLKYKGFGNAVNITLGLPLIRTSVDHGTALDLAGSGKANSGSLRTALNSALAMVQAQAKGPVTL